MIAIDWGEERACARGRGGRRRERGGREVGRERDRGASAEDGGR